MSIVVLDAILQAEVDMSGSVWSCFQYRAGYSQVKEHVKSKHMLRYVHDFVSS